MVFEWQAGLWRRVIDSAGRMPHALLLAGPAGGGKRVFAETLAARVLCSRPGPRVTPVGFAKTACGAFRAIIQT